MNRRALLAGSVGLFAGPPAARAQPAGKVYRIGFLQTGQPTSPEATRVTEALLKGLQELGYVEGRNLVIERRYPAEGKIDRLPDAAAELVRLKVDVIVASGSLTPHAAKRATTTIPIVFPNHGDPVGSGLVASLARPGGNITGLSLLNTELVGKQVELLKETVPRVVRVAVLWNPASQIHPRTQNEEERAFQTFHLQRQRVAARGLDDYERAFSAMSHARADAVLVLGDPVFWGHRTQIAELATRGRLPSMFVQREHAEAGGFMSYGANLRDSFRRAATFVDKILRGARPADPADRAADEIRARDQPPDREGARADDPAGRAGPGG